MQSVAYCRYEDGQCVVCGHKTAIVGLIRECGYVPMPEMTRTDAPSFLNSVKNFARAAVSHVAAGMPMASDEEIIRRHDICLTCEHLRDDSCNLCGCPINRVAGYVSKLSWADQECPAGKWGRTSSA